MQLACNNLSFQYPDSGARVLDRLSFSLQGPGIHAVFGPSGIGKTSLARIISTGITRYEGDLCLKEIKTVLYTYNMERLPTWASIQSLLKQVTPSGREPLLEELVRVFALEELMDARFSRLSLGQQNRANLVRYLVQDFDLLILDESLANVDERLRQIILLHIKARFPEKMFLSISHNLMEVAIFCKKIVLLGAQNKGEQGRLIQGMDLQQDHAQDISLDKKQLDAVMLEIMNAC
ncbi:MAG: ATP-binding cassette domain-containing protein [Candidatus Electrothrix sp. GW3-4]|uniref:ATP-binding cassette domain-containing protein n=1 Tax=Candidatus Electrothrix sp. GW3-4 TaxID=3126740 RepID=UPI0030CB8E55